MNSAELKKVNSGDKFAPKAPDWNAFVDAALATRNTFSDQKSGRLLRTSDNGVVPLRNDTGADQDQFAVVSLDTILITPTDNEDEFRHRPPVFSGIAVASGNLTKPFAILQEPLKTDLIGCAMVEGVTPVKITVSDASHAYAGLSATGLVSASSGIVRILWKETGTGSKWAIVHFPAGGGGSSSYTLFEVVKLSDTSVQINGYNVSAGRYSRNYVILGLSRFELADAATVTGITLTGMLYLRITCADGTLTPVFATVLPAQDTTYIYHPLADIICAGGIISTIYQPPTGVIHYPARAL